jgi:group I intron endonuclease
MNSPVEGIRTMIIYKITSPSGRVYIGQTKNTKERWARYRDGECGNQYLLRRSLMKYGWINHKFEEIETITGTKTECNSKEMFWIRTYMSNRHRYRDGNGMNATDGGNGILGLKHSDESKKLMGNATSKRPGYWAGKPMMQEVKDKIKATKKARYEQGLAGPNKGKKMSQDTKDKIAKTKKGTKIGKDNPFYGKKHTPESMAKMVFDGGSKPVIQYDLNYNKIGEFKSIIEAARTLKMGVYSIRLIMQGKRKKPRRFHFKYKSDVDESNQNVTNG